MSKIELSDLPSGFATTTALNARLDQIETEFNEKVLYRSNPEGEPNAMDNLLDMANNPIINVPDAIEDHEAVNLGQVIEIVEEEVYEQIAEQMLLVGTGNVVGPASALDDQVALFDGITGKLIKGVQTMAQYLSAFLVTLYNIFPVKIVSVAALNAYTPIAGQVVDLVSYIDGLGKGGGQLIAKSGAVTPNNVTTFASSVIDVYFERINTHIEAEHAGAIGDGVTDDYAALQRYFTWADATGYVYDVAASGGSAYSGATRVLSSQTSVFCISNTLVIGPYANFDFNHSAFTPHASFPPANFTLDIHAYINRFSNLKLMKFKNGFRLSNANLNSTRVVFENIDASGTDVLFDIDLQSAITSIKDSRFDNVNTVVKISRGDMVLVEGCWLSATEFPANDRAHFEINSTTHPGLKIQNLLYVPWPQTKEDLSIVRVAGSPARVTIKDSHFGGEPGQIPIIRNFAAGGGGISSRGCHFTIDNVMGYTTTSGGSGSGAIKPAVELYALPDTLTFLNYYGAIEQSHTKNLVAYNTAIQSYATALAAVPGSKIYIDGRIPENFGGFQSTAADNLALLHSSPFTVERKLFKSVTNATTTAELLAAAVAGRGAAYRLILTTPANNASDRYCEYVVVASSPPATAAIWTLLPIIEGASTVAGRAYIDAGTVKIRGNSVAVIDVLATLELITNTDKY